MTYELIVHLGQLNTNLIQLIYNVLIFRLHLVVILE